MSGKACRYVSVHERASSATPTKLSQAYMEVPLEQKMNMLWSFVKSHLNNKCIVFLSSCKQVKFVYEAFCRLRPGIPLQCLHGKIKQAKRVHIFQDFTQSPKAVLFATDIAARGLDFPAVDWVLQVVSTRGVSVEHAQWRIAASCSPAEHAQPPLPPTVAVMAALRLLAGRLSGGCGYIHPPRGPHGTIPLWLARAVVPSSIGDADGRQVG